MIKPADKASLLTMAPLFAQLAAMQSQVAAGERERAAAPTCRWCFGHSQSLTGCNHCDADGEQTDNIPAEE